jgi:hypothetical protein
MSPARQEQLEIDTMNALHLPFPPRLGCFRWGGLLVLSLAATLIFVAEAPASSLTPCAKSSDQPGRVQKPAIPAAGASAPHLAGLTGSAFLATSWWQTFYNTLSKLVSNQRGMLQFGFIGMLLCLVVIWWRK